MWKRGLGVIEKEDPQEADHMRGVMTQEREARGSQHSGEYGTLIIHSMETGRPRVVYGNVGNNGIIANLPGDCVVEVPCLVDTIWVQHIRARKNAVIVLFQDVTQRIANLCIVVIEQHRTGDSTRLDILASPPAAPVTPGAGNAPPYYVYWN